MKKSSLLGMMHALSLSFLFITPVSASIIMNEGDIALIEFDDLSVVGPTQYPESFTSSFAIINYTDFTAGEQLLASYHEDFLSDTPVDTDTLDGNFAGGSGFWSLNLHSAFVDDLQGVIRLESISGTIGISSLEIELIAYGTEYYGEFGAVVVPVPAAAWLFGSGLLGLIGFAQHKKL